ncbi:MAG: flagellar filament capping protein FliD [Treponema sp.]|jgi:flagellar hook-associated protein 2|nr:flagellar filament capping protein FliD [Treponema sp.]
MSDIYIPGVRSRLNTDQLIEGLMELERVPRNRIENNIENLQLQRGYWQEVGRRINSVRDSARFLYSFQNPFNDRIAESGNDAVITASTTREATEQSYSFTVKQTAQADRFLSQPLDEKTRIEAGNYIFSVANDEININFRGGTLRDFADAINRRGRDKISASLLAVQSGTRSLLIESKVTGAANRLGFSGDSIELATRIGMMEQGNDSQKDIAINESTVRRNGQNSANITINDGVLKAAPGSSASLPIGLSLSADSPVMLKLDTLTRVEADGIFNISQSPPGPSIPSGSVTYNGITIENEPSLAPMPESKQPVAAQRRDDMAVLSLVFSDGSSAKLPSITDSNSFTTRQYLLSDVAQGRTIVSLNIENSNTHREVSIGNIEIFDPTVLNGGLKPMNAVSTARDAVITMEGIEIKRPTNTIDDLIPGLTLNVKGVSERPVELNVRGDVEGVKNAIITFVGNYNRLMAEINVLTTAATGGITRDKDGNMVRVRSDRADRIVDELTYLTADEAAAMKDRVGALSGDSTLNTLKNNLMRAITAPYPTSLERDLTLLAQIGISTNAGGNIGYDPSSLRGYLQIDEKKLDASLETKIPVIRQLFANDTTGDRLMDTGIAVNVDNLVRPFVETGGIISLKSGTIDSRISQDERRIATIDRQLAAKEAELRLQYARMEAAYAQMEQTSASLENFNQQNRGNR